RSTGRRAGGTGRRARGTGRRARAGAWDRGRMSIVKKKMSEIGSGRELRVRDEGAAITRGRELSFRIDPSIGETVMSNTNRTYRVSSITQLLIGFSKHWDLGGLHVNAETLKPKDVTTCLQAVLDAAVR